MNVNTAIVDIKQEINNIIIEMGATFDTNENVLHFIIDRLEDKGFSRHIDLIGIEQTVDMITIEVKVICNDIEYQSSIENVIAKGLSQFFESPKMTIAEAARLYAEKNKIIGNFDDVLNHVVTHMVKPVLETNENMTIRDAIIFLGQGGAAIN